MQKKSRRYLLSYLPDGSTRREVGPGVHSGPQFGGRGGKGGRRGFAMVPFERVTMVS